MSLPPPEPSPVDAALAAYIEQRIDERLGQERALCSPRNANSATGCAS